MQLQELRQRNRELELQRAQLNGEVADLKVHIRVEDEKLTSSRGKRKICVSAMWSLLVWSIYDCELIRCMARLNRRPLLGLASLD